MLHLHPLCSFLALFLPAVPDADPRPALDLPLEVRRPAPDIGIDEWVGEKRPGKVMKKVARDLGGREVKGFDDLDELMGLEDPGELASHHGKVLFIHVVVWDDPVTGGKLVELVGDLTRANEDRGLEAVAIAQTGEGVEASAKRGGVTWPIATTDLANATSPYVDIDEKGRPTAFLIGRSGELAWRGDPIEGKRAFLVALDGALDRTAALRIERSLAEDLGSALDEYYVGKLTKAASLAKKIASAAERSSDLLVEQDARLVLDMVRDTEVEWLRAMRDAASRRRQFGEFLAYVDALSEAFPRTSGKEAKEAEKELAREGHNLARLKEERAWRELHVERPPLFPARKERASDRFAKEVQEFVDDARSATEATRRAQDLLDRYRGAGR